MNPDISIWLVPKKAERKKLEKIINKLANQYGAYPFIPHITLYYLKTSMSLESVIKIIKGIVIDTEELTLQAKDIKYSDIFTKTLYVEYEISSSLQKLYQQLKTKK